MAGRILQIRNLRNLVLNDINDLFRVFGSDLTVEVYLGNSETYEGAGKDKVKVNVRAIGEYIGPKYKVNPIIKIDDTDCDGNIIQIRYGAKITRRRI
ncbi:MAG: hypothetical protein AABY22_18525 [Nanoarchaeota archaeon]